MRAQRGRVSDHLLSEFMNHPFLAQAPPKSLDRQVFGPAFLQQIIKEHPGMSGDDLVATLTQFTVNATMHAILTHLNKGRGLEELIVYGGGARNPQIMARLRAALPKMLVSSGDDYGIPSDAREAVAFAVLAHATLCNMPGNLPSFIGAARAVPLGAICFPC